MTDDKLTNNITDVALIFEGGAMRASYTAPVVVTLLREKMFFDYVAGISAGSSHTANYLSRDPERARQSFVDFAADPHFGNLRTFLQGKGMFNADYIYQEAGRPGAQLPYDFDTFAANPARFAIGAFEADTGEGRYFTREDAPTLDDLMIRVQASSSLPFFMPNVEINNHIYVDGALSQCGGIALDAAQEAGYTRFFIVLTRERGYVKEPFKITRPIRSYFRHTPAVLDALDARADNYNRTREEIFDLEASGQALVFAPWDVSVSSSERNTSVLMQSYAAGAAQANAELPRWKDWLNL